MSLCQAKAERSGKHCLTGSICLARYGSVPCLVVNTYWECCGPADIVGGSRRADGQEGGR